MRDAKGASGLAAAVAGLAASLVFFVSGLVIAGHGDAQAGVRGDFRRGDPAAESAMRVAEEAADNCANCGKCHSPCENGRSHEGLVSIGFEPAKELPLDTEGRTTCVTCHEPHRSGVAGKSALLRIPNLRRELCLACHRQETAENPRVVIVSPLERAIVQDDRLAFIGTASRLSGALLTLRLNGAEFHLHVKEDEFFTWLKLQDGTNRIEVALDERLLWSGEVFLAENATGGYDRTSSGHRTGNREQCRGCHPRDDGMRAVTADAAPALCYGCHDRNDEKRYVHGPLAVGDCLACHDPHGGYGTAHLRREQASLCGNCHAARENARKVACGASGKGCVDCHDPHQSDTRFLLKGPQYTMRDIYPGQR